MPRPQELLVRSLQQADWHQVVEVYSDAVQSLAVPYYRAEQVAAWAHHPRHNPSFEAALQRGFGLVGTTTDRPDSVEAFALLDPSDRLALLYCRGRSSRQGLATRLVKDLEQHARSSGQTRLHTEASQLSRPLLERLGWGVDREETILFAGESFVRWRMSRSLL